ncbi:MAG TPA: anti-sigma factor antagonist [Nitrospirae bacterium]|nr:anti-sigma factor antagonist [Nitrospirota bacterium]
MKIDLVDYQGNKVIEPSGDIDMYSSPVLRKELMRQIDAKAQLLLVDFSNVSYIDSSGIATFVEGLKTMKTYGGRLKLIGLPESIMEIFRFSKLDSIFEIYGNMDEAINS